MSFTLFTDSGGKNTAFNRTWSSTGPDLLVMITHEQKLHCAAVWQEPYKAMVYDTHVPLLVLKDRKNVE
jgi:hypothetical protein